MTFHGTQDSYLTIGGVPGFVKDVDDVVCHRIAGSFHWQLKLMGIRVGDDREIKTITVPLMLTDTGTTLTYLPQKNYDDLIAVLCENQECINTDDSRL